MTKDYKKIKLQNGVRNALNEAMADIIIKRLKIKIKAYQNKNITASELLNYLSEHK